MSYQISPFQNIYAIPYTREMVETAYFVVEFGSRNNFGGPTQSIYATAFSLLPIRNGYSDFAENVVEYETVPDDLLALLLECEAEKNALQLDLDNCLVNCGGGIVPQISTSPGCNKMLFCQENMAASSTITCTPSLPVTDVENIKSESRSEKIQTVNTTQELLIKFDDVQTINFIHIDRHNISANGLIGVEFLDVNDIPIPDTAITDYPAQAAAIEDEFSYYVPGEISVFFDWEKGQYFTTILIDNPIENCKALKITIIDAGNQDGYLEICRLFTGFAIKPRYNFSWGISLDWENNDKFIRTDGGTLQTKRKGDAFRVIKLAFEMIGLDERRYWTTMKRMLRGKICFLSCYPSFNGIMERDFTGIFKVTDMGALVNDDIDNFTLDSMKFEET